MPGHPGTVAGHHSPLANQDNPNDSERTVAPAPGSPRFPAGCQPRRHRSQCGYATLPQARRSDLVIRVSDPGARWTVPDPARLATAIRLRAVRMVRPQGFGYLGQALSSAEQVAALFAVMRPGRDRLVCSPGHY